MPVGTISSVLLYKFEFEKKSSNGELTSKVEGLLGFRKSLKFKLNLKSHCGEARMYIIALLDKG